MFRTSVFCVLALLGFAANSLLTRLALRPRLIDAASFSLAGIYVVLPGLGGSAPSKDRLWHQHHRSGRHLCPHGLAGRLSNPSKTPAFACAHGCARWHSQNA